MISPPNQTFPTRPPTDLLPDTNYILYCIAEDDETISNIQDEITSISFSTPGLPPVIISQPIAQSLCEESDVIFEVTSTSTTEINYQWYKNETLIEDATSNQLAFINISIEQIGS